MPDDVLSSRIRTKLESRQRRSILRRLTPPFASATATGKSEADALIDFSSNDYLGLAHSPSLRDSFLQALQSRSVGEYTSILGSTGSRLLDGNTYEHVQLESRLASYFRSPSALLHTSGFDANVGFFGSLPSEGDWIVYDELIHASVHDGMRASRVYPSSRISFKHNSLKDLRRVLEGVMDKDENVKNGKSLVWIAVEGLYSMDGDIAPLDLFMECVERLLVMGNGHVIVDEAHSSGVYGEGGRGVVCMLGLEGRVTARLCTFGKAFGSNGAVILTSPLIRQYLINYSRPLIYTTALASYNSIAVQCSLDIIQSPQGTELSRKALGLAEYFRRGMSRVLSQALTQHAVLLPSLPSELSSSVVASLVTPIIPLITPHPRELSAYLRERYDILARPVVYPTVPEGEERVRICIHANNTRDQVDRLLAGVSSWIHSNSPPLVSDHYSPSNTPVSTPLMARARL